MALDPSPAPAVTPELLDDPLPFPSADAATPPPGDDVAALAAAAVQATARGHARARAGDWPAAAAALAESVAHRERLVHLEAAGPAVTVRGWLELAIAELAQARPAEARALLARARAAIALADPGPQTGALHVAVEDAWARVADAPPSPAPADDAAWTLALADSVASAERAAAEATRAASAADAAADAVERSFAFLPLDEAPLALAPIDMAPLEGALLEADPIEAEAIEVARIDVEAADVADARGARRDGAAPFAEAPIATPAAPDVADAAATLDELAFLLPPAPTSGTAGSAPDDAPRAEPEASPAAPTIALATGGAPPALDGLLLLDEDAPPAEPASPWRSTAPAVEEEDELEFLSPTAGAGVAGAVPDALGAGAALPADAALAGSAKPRVHVVLPDFPEEAPKKGGILSRLRGIVRR